MSDSKLTPPAGQAPMSVRECRLILERLLVAAGLPAGAVLSVRDVLLDAELRGLGLLALLHREPELLEGATIEPLRPAGANGELRLDAGGQFSLFVAPAILDLLIEHSTVEGVCRLRVVGVERPALLDALVISGRAARLVVDVDPDGQTTAVIRARTAAATADAPELTRALRDGITIDGTIWLDLYMRSNRALVPESAAMRAHAGHLDVNDQGRIVKPMDDDVDVEHALVRFRGAP